MPRGDCLFRRAHLIQSDLHCAWPPGRRNALIRISSICPLRCVHS